MALELVFKRPLTIGRLRSGPLGKHLEGFCDWLLQNGFNPLSAREHLIKVSHLNVYLADVGVGTRRTVAAEDIERFLKAYPSRCRNRAPVQIHMRYVRHSINRFVRYLREASLIKLPPKKADYHHRLLLDGYLSWMRGFRNAADTTLAQRACCIEWFLQWLGPEASVQSIKRLSPDKVEHYFLDYAQGKGGSSRRVMQSSLRTFFRFCLYKGYTRRPLDRAVPRLRTYRLSTVPRGLTDSQAQRVLRCIDRGTHAGRRDYAIIQLLYTYGVRGGQIRSLQFQDIDWTANHILFKAYKRGKDIRVPLTPEVGESLLDYLRNARPSSRAHQVFLTCHAPYHPLPKASTLSSIVKQRICAAGIELQIMGTHAFRYCFATRMLQQGHSLKAIADLLGHRLLTTTFIYTKVDYDALKQVALEWPVEVSA